MKRFEVGHIYYDAWACNSDSISKIKIIKRTAKTVTFQRGNETRRAKLYENEDGEYIIPDHYSMACVYRAERELLGEQPAEAIQQPAPAADKYTVAEGFIKMAIAECVLGVAGAGTLNEKQYAFMDALIKNSN